MLILASQALAEEESERKFTNWPNLKGQPGWTYVPSKPQKEEPQRPTSPPLPPEKYKDFMTSDYSNRDEFEKLVFKKIDGNPFKIDVMAEVAKADQALPQLFNEFFAGRVYWGDRDKLSKEQADEWADVVKRWHAHVYNQVVSKKQAMMEEHKWMMSQFDYAWKQYQANLKRYRDQR